MDVVVIPFGVDFRIYLDLDEQVAKCEVFLAVIGRDWGKKRDSKGKSRPDLRTQGISSDRDRVGVTTTDPSDSSTGKRSFNPAG